MASDKSKRPGKWNNHDIIQQEHTTIFKFWKLIIFI